MRDFVLNLYQHFYLLDIMKLKQNSDMFLPLAQRVFGIYNC